MYNAKILGLGSFLPAKKVDNKELYKLVKNFDLTKARSSFAKRNINPDQYTDEVIFDMWVKQVSGISYRYHFSDADLGEIENYNPDNSVELMGYYAAKEAIQDAKMELRDIESVIFVTVTSDQFIPNPGCIASNFLGLTKPSAITCNTACSGFVDALGIAYAKIASGIHENVLIIASEKFSTKLNYNDPTSSILFGDGAGACLVGRSDSPNIKGYCSESNFSLSITYGLNIPLAMGGGPMIQKNAVTSMYHIAQRAAEKSETEIGDYDYIVPHQANIRILEQLSKKMKIDFDKMVVTIGLTANISCATIPFSLGQLKQNKLAKYPYKENSKILLTALGGGYAYSACSLIL